MKQFIQFSCLLACVAAFTSCKKEDDKISRAYMLMNGGWHATAATSNGAEGLPPCLADNTYYFYGNRTAIVELGAIRCSSNDGILTGYSFTKSEDTLYMTYSNASSDIWKIRSASETEFVLEEWVTENGPPRTVVVTFTRK